MVDDLASMREGFLNSPETVLVRTDTGCWAFGTSWSPELPTPLDCFAVAVAALVEDPGTTGPAGQVPDPNGEGFVWVAVSAADVELLSRGVVVSRVDGSVSVSRPSACPHDPHPLGACTEMPVNPDVPCHDFPHRASCGCWCSGMLRWEYLENRPLPDAVVPLLVSSWSTLSSRLEFQRSWPWFDLLWERLDRPAQWVSLWVTCVVPLRVGSADDELLESVANADEVCNAAFASDRGGL